MATTTLDEMAKPFRLWQAKAEGPMTPSAMCAVAEAPTMSMTRPMTATAAP
jgi:hypothetical protein